MNKSVQLPFVEILSYLSLIERSVPNIDNFSLYTPTPDFKPNDVVSIQNEAKRMMEFIGLKGYTTLVTPCSTDNGTAGNINLNNSMEVFIEIDKGMERNRKNFKEAVLCVMAHEICHKFLYSHGLNLEDTDKNEYCTDLATFFVGFGLLTINGCYETYVTPKKNADGTSSMVTTTHRTGYLTPRNYLAAHQVVCKVHNLDYLEGISAEMRKFLSESDTRPICYTQLSRESVVEKFKLESTPLANKKREIILLKSYLEIKEKELMSYYERNDRLYNRLLLYGNAVEKLPYTTMHVLNIPQENTCISENLDALEIIEPKYHETLENKLLTLKCPFCGAVANAKIKESGLSIRKCQCGKVFYWDSSTFETCNAARNTPSDAGDSPRETPLNKASNWFRNLLHRYKSDNSHRL